MTGRLLLSVVMAGAATALGAAPQTASPPAQQVPTFRSVASAVAVDVSVRDRSRRVMTGLTAADFEVRDNGVMQTVASVSYGKLPIDVTIALDVSYSVTGPMLERLRRGVVQLMGDLARQDRLKLMLFNMRVNRTVDFTTDTDSVERAIRLASAGGGTALLDAVSVSLVSATAPDRRQLVVFFTDGSDSSSVTTPSALTTVAQRSRATLTFVMPTAMAVTAVQTTGQAVLLRGSAPTPGPVRPFSALFGKLASETGGTIVPVNAGADLSSAFRRILEDFRQAYVLFYNARGVDRGGYHTLDVVVKRQGAQVQARRGYWQ